MARNAELLEITHSLINKLHDDINVLQQQALRYSAEGNYEKCGESLQKQREAINAQIAMVDAAKYLATR